MVRKPGDSGISLALCLPAVVVLQSSCEGAAGKAQSTEGWHWQGRLGLQGLLQEGMVTSQFLLDASLRTWLRRAATTLLPLTVPKVMLMVMMLKMVVVKIMMMIMIS